MNHAKGSNLKERIIYGCAIGFGVLMLVLLFRLNWYVEFDTSTMKPVVEYNEIISYPKAYLRGSVLFKKGFELKVTQTQGFPSYEEIGQYENIYFAKSVFGSKSLKTTIYVQDHTKPILTLKGNQEYNIEPGQTFTDPGCFASDEQDGLLTDNIKLFVEEDKITYYVEDKSGNGVFTERIVTRLDKTPPTIELIGEKEITLNQFATYEELGASAKDDYDGDISKNIVTTGEVNTEIAGIYPIKYDIVDKSGNKATIERIVKVAASEVVANGETIYLTFDDGPSQYTTQLLDTLDKYNVKATFFVVGERQNDAVLKEIVERGHAIGIHCNTHEYSKIYQSPTIFKDDLLEMQKKIEDVTGVKTYLMRFPGGSSNTVSANYYEGIMTELVRDVEVMGFTYYDWNVGSGDTDGLTTEKDVFDKTIQGIQSCGTSVVLQHDTKSYSVDAVDDIIEWGIANGYEFAPLTKDDPTMHHKVNN